MASTNPLLRMAGKSGKSKKKGEIKMNTDRRDKLVKEALSKLKKEEEEVKETVEEEEKGEEVDVRELNEKVDRILELLSDVLDDEDVEEEEEEEAFDDESLFEESDGADGRGETHDPMKSKGKSKLTQKANYPGKPGKPKLLSEKEEMSQKVETQSTIPEQSKVTSQTSKQFSKSAKRDEDYFVGKEPKADAGYNPVNIGEPQNLMKELITNILEKGVRYKTVDLMKMVS